MTDVSSAVADTAPEQELADVAEYVIRVNGKEVWRSKGQAMLVNSVKMSNARGEVTVIGSSNQDKYLDITVSERSFDDPDTYLDMIEEKKLQERRKQFEPAPDTSREGYVEADPETGQPVEKAAAPAETTTAPAETTPSAKDFSLTTPTP